MLNLWSILFMSRKHCCMNIYYTSFLLKCTLSAVMTGISLGLLKSTEAAQNGTKKKGVFLQKAGRMLDPYLPEKITTLSIKTV